jgi:hypothetical protein
MGIKFSHVFICLTSNSNGKHPVNAATNEMDLYETENSDAQGSAVMPSVGKF